jgi:hypothetical protein
VSNVSRTEHFHAKPSASADFVPQVLHVGQSSNAAQGGSVSSGGSSAAQPSPRPIVGNPSSPTPSTQPTALAMNSDDVRPMTLAPTPDDGAASSQALLGPSFDSGGSGGSGGPVDYAGWKVVISGGSDYSIAGGFVPGQHPGDTTPAPPIPQGSQFVGYPLLSAPTGGAGYQLVNFTWTFPTGAVKGYGEFSQATEGPGEGGGSTYTWFSGAPSTSLAQDPSLFPFTSDDLNWTSPGDDHVVDSFYWGPASVGISTVSVTATFEKIVDDQVVDTFQGSDSAKYNVILSTGSISILQFGTAGLSTQTDDVGQYWLGLDKNSHVLPAATRPVGIQYSLSVTTPATGSFTAIQTMQYKENRQWTDTGRNFHKEQNGFYVDSETGQPVTNQDGTKKSMTDYPTLDSIAGIGYGFRLNDPTMGPDSPTQPTLTAASVRNANGVVNKLYGNDSPGTPLPKPPTPTWEGGIWSRTDDFTITLMYNPDPNASGGVGGGAANSIWIPVGKLTWSWTATAGYFTFNNPNPKWVSQGSPTQTPGTYSPTTQFPAWTASRNDASQGFSTFFPIP